MYSTILPEHIILVTPPIHPPLPRTAKGNVQRRATQRRFAPQLAQWFGELHDTDVGTVRLDDCRVGWLSFELAQQRRFKRPSLPDGSVIVGVTVDSLQSMPYTPQQVSRSSIVLAHLYVLSMALVLLHHMPKVRESCASCGVLLFALERFGEAIAMPAFCVLAGVRDRQLASCAAMWKVAVRTALLFSCCLYLAYFTTLPDKVHVPPLTSSKLPEEAMLRVVVLASCTYC